MNPVVSEVPSLEALCALLGGTVPALVFSGGSSWELSPSLDSWGDRARRAGAFPIA